MKNKINDQETNKIYIFPKIFPSLNPEESVKYLYIFKNDSLTKELSILNNSSNDKEIINNDNQFDSIENIIELQKGRNRRTPKLKNIIFEFISKTDVYDKIKEFELNSYEKLLENSISQKKTNNNEEIIFSKIQEKLNLLVENINFNIIKKGDFLVKINDKMNYVYFLVIGRLALLKPIQLNNYKITYTEYIQYLLELKIKKENYLLEETLKLNSSILRIESLNEFKQFIKIYFQIKINERLKKNLITFPQIEDYLNQYQMKFEEIDLNKEEMEQIYIKSLKTQNNNQWNDYVKKSFKLSGTSVNFFSPYQKIFQTNEKLNCTIFRYDLNSYLNPGNYYGDSQEKNSVRAEQDSFFAFIPKELFLNITSENKKKEKLKELLFLWENFIFQNLSPLIFEKYYFPLFKLVDFKRNEILYEQGSEITKLYLIKEGQVTINFYGNMIDIFNIIKFCIDKIIEKNPMNLTISELNELKILYLDDKDLLKVKRKDYLFKNSILKKQKFEICIMDGYVFFVLDEFFLSNHHLTTCKVSTEKAKLYQINESDFSRIIKEEKNIKTEFLSLAYNQIISLIKRLYNLKKSFISMGHYKIQLANNDIKNILEENKRNNLSQHKFFIYQNEEIYKNTNWSPLFLQNEKKKLKNNQKSQDYLTNITKIKSYNKKDNIINDNIFSFRKNDKTNDDVKFTNLRLKNIRKEFLNNKNVKTLIKINNSYIDIKSFQNEFSKQKYVYQKEENKKIVGVNLFDLNKSNQKSNILKNQGFFGNKIINKKKQKIHRRTMEGILKNISQTFDKNLIKNSSKKILVNTVKKYYQNFQKYSYILKLDNNKFNRSNSVLNMVPKIQIN